MKQRTSKVAFLGIFTALAMILSYIESQIPTFVAIPGIKLGLPNIAIIVVLYCIGFKEATFINLVRVILVSLLFSSTLTMAYGLAGATLSLIVMGLLKKSNFFSPIVVSVAGAISHNIGQIIVAIFVTQTSQLMYYLPILLFTGTISGVIIGLIGAQVVKKTEKIMNKEDEK